MIDATAVNHLCCCRQSLMLLPPIIIVRISSMRHIVNVSNRQYVAVNILTVNKFFFSLTAVVPILAEAKKCPLTVKMRQY
jgi:hypothetical protein